MISTEYLITSFVLVLMPGTGVIYTVSMGLLLGKRAAFSASVGCTLGIVPSMLASVFGLAVILNTSAMAFQVVKFLGVAYLLYLAWGMWKSTGSLDIDQKESNSVSLFQVAIRGCLINILNPKLTIFFLAFLPQFIDAQTSSTINQMLLLGGVFMAMTLFVFILYGLLAGNLRQYLVSSSKIATYLQQCFAASFALLAAKLAFTER